jgi:PHYB activation tagged suppressor 1
MEMAGAEADVIWWWAWAWRSVTAAACLLLALHVAEALWWRPRRLEAHFAAQGVRGPPYRFLLGSVLEMQEHMEQAGAKPMSPQDSHDALPRVLPFYHHWRAKYGKHRASDRGGYPFSCARSHYFLPSRLVN